MNRWSVAISALLLCVFVGTARAQTRPDTEPPAPNAAEQWSHAFERDHNGFTIFPLGEGAQIIQVSTTDGSDSNDGLTRPVRTLKRAVALARNGFPDQILFKRGDIFEMSQINSNLPRGGRSDLEPMIIGAYGDAHLPRPILKGGISLGGREGRPDFLVIEGLDFYADTRDPSLPGFDVNRMDTRQMYGIHMYSPGRNLWIEDCRVRDFESDIVLEAKPPILYQTVVVRRCVLTDAWSNTSHAQGIYINAVKDVLIEESLFDHDGWIEGVPKGGKTVFNHDLYLQHGELGEDLHFIVRDNIMARASSHGCQLRPGGLLENNLFLKNPLAAFVAYSPSVVRNNVVLDGDNIGPTQPRGQGFEFLNCPTILAEGNIIAHKTDPTNNLSALGYDPHPKNTPSNPSMAEIRDNIVYDWRGPALDTHSSIAGLSVHDNQFIQGDSSVIWLWKLEPRFVFSHNRYQSHLSAPFYVENRGMDAAAWDTMTGDQPDPTPPQFPDPSRDIASYARSIHMDAPTLEGFLSAAREQRHGNWNANLSASAVNDYIRAGFEKAAAPPTSIPPETRP